jgi:chromosome partitioning protein
MTTIVAIANEKGGVAKTTTALSLGGAFVESKREVLVVDLDPQANLALALGVKPAAIRKSSADLLLRNSPMSSVSRETALPGLDLVPAHAELARAEEILPQIPGYANTLRAALNGDLYYDYVILDCPPSLGAITLNALTAADLLIIPTQAEYFSSHALRDMLGFVRMVREEHNPGLTYRILITMLDLRNRIHRLIQNQLETTFPESLCKTVIQVDTRLRESPVVGLPITYFSADTRGAEQYRALSKEVAEYAFQPAPQPA